jgi:hypothetical protein
VIATVALAGIVALVGTVVMMGKEAMVAMTVVAMAVATVQAQDQA